MLHQKSNIRRAQFDYNSNVFRTEILVNNNWKNLLHHQGAPHPHLKTWLKARSSPSALTSAALYSSLLQPRLPRPHLQRSRHHLHQVNTAFTSIRQTLPSHPSSKCCLHLRQAKTSSSSSNFFNVGFIGISFIQLSYTIQTQQLSIWKVLIISNIWRA